MAPVNYHDRQLLVALVSPKLSTSGMAQFTAFGIEDEKLVAIQSNEESIYSTIKFLIKTHVI